MTGRKAAQSKRNLYKEKLEYLLSAAQAEGTIMYQNEAKTIYTGIPSGIR